MEHKKYLSEIGRRGGMAGRGKAKIRGGKEYYRAMQAKSCLAKKKKKLFDNTNR